MPHDQDSPPAPLPPLPPLPDPVGIPVQLIEAWLGLPSDTYVEARLTRSDLDRFYSIHNKSLQSQFKFQQAMIAYTNGRNADANIDLHQAQVLIAEAQNDLRQFMSALMAGATTARR